MMIDWILQSSLHEWVNSGVWTWPIAETIHFFGLCLMLGALIFIDMRMMGFFRGVSFSSIHSLLPLVFVGFGMNLVTGILFFFGDPERYSINIGFQIKMGLVLIAGVNAVWFYWKINEPMKTWASHEDAPLDAKIVGAISLAGWIAVLLLGRLIPYVGTG